ncbi:MAG TPA: glycosyl hydrolase [Streptosporangiaceae bacterium]
MRGRVVASVVLASSLALAGWGMAGCGARAGGKPKIQSTLRAGVAPTPPARGAYFGAWADSGVDSLTQQGRIQSMLDFEKKIGRELDIVHTYRTWTQPFPRAADNAVLNSDRYLMLSWNGIDTKVINSGSQDKVIYQRAAAIKATGKPIFLRWQWEMDRPNARGKIHSPAQYIAAWKRIRAIFRQVGVDNVAWVWCPTAKGFTSRDHAAAYYPGDDEVDWVCADAYPSHQAAYRDLSEVMAGFMKWAKRHPKPIMIGEFGVPRSYGPRRPEWLRNAAKTLQNPQIKAVLYFNSDMEDRQTDKRVQFSLDGDPAAMSAMRELATLPFFNPRNVPVQSD